jgi:hypothetical protein
MNHNPGRFFVQAGFIVLGYRQGNGQEAKDQQSPEKQIHGAGVKIGLQIIAFPQHLKVL